MVCNAKLSVEAYFTLMTSQKTNWPDGRRMYSLPSGVELRSSMEKKKRKRRRCLKFFYEHLKKSTKK